MADHKTISQRMCQAVFAVMCIVGRPLGGIRPRRLYDTIGRRAYPAAAFRWVTNRWGDELLLSPHYHIDRNIIAFGAYDLQLHRAMRRMVRPGMMCVDAGANLGEMTLHMARLVGPEGKVFAFEPVPHIHQRLCEHVRHNGASEIVDCRDVALTDQSGTMAMSIPAADADNQGLGSIVGDIGCDAAVDVETVTLDAFLDGRRVDFIKLDIQGGEWRFLGGAAETLSRHHPILVTEVSPDDLAPAGVTSREYLLKLIDLGYRIHRLTARGPGEPIDPHRVADDFYATNVVCLPPGDSERTPTV